MQMNRMKRPIFHNQYYFITSVAHGRRRWFAETDFAQIVYLALDLQLNLKVYI